MSRAGSAFVVSIKSWILDEENRLQRPDKCARAVGVGRGGQQEVAEISVDGSPSKQLRMYEIFATSAYSLVEAATRITTIGGFMPAGELHERVQLGQEIFLEPFLGPMLVEAAGLDDLRPAAHSRYLPINLLQNAMEHCVGQGSADVVVPRALFSQLVWMMQHVAKQSRRVLQLAPDNMTFPTEVALVERDDPRCRVLCVTAFAESEAVLIRLNQRPWRLVCDGLLVAV